MGQAKQMFTQQRDEEQQIKQGLTLTSKKLQDLDKDGIVELARAVVSEVQMGDQDAMDTLIMGKKLELFAKQIVDNVKDYAYGKSYATKGNPYMRFGTKVEAAELGTEYSYENCNDPQFTDLEIKFNSAKAAFDKRKKFLQTLPAPMSVMDDDTNEVTVIHPAIKSSTSGYKVNI